MQFCCTANSKVGWRRQKRSSAANAPAAAAAPVRLAKEVIVTSVMKATVPAHTKAKLGVVCSAPSLDSIKGAIPTILHLGGPEAELLFDDPTIGLQCRAKNKTKP